MKVLVLGASEKLNKYSNMAVHMLLNYEHEVVAIGNKEGAIGNIQIEKPGDLIKGVDTLTLYLGPKNQPPLFDYILDCKPKRVIFNPGTENPVLYKLLRQNNIYVEIACTLVLLRTNQF
ncbi:CoA-binding protein [Crocinitomix catalasitica]|nr:CoA-binding protein [Crocinitomix catalasitica]